MTSWNHDDAPLASRRRYDADSVISSWSAVTWVEAAILAISGLLILKKSSGVDLTALAVWFLCGVVQVSSRFLVTRLWGRSSLVISNFNFIRLGLTTATAVVHGMGAYVFLPGVDGPGQIAYFSVMATLTLTAIPVLFDRIVMFLVYAFLIWTPVAIVLAHASDPWVLYIRQGLLLITCMLLIRHVREANLRAYQVLAASAARIKALNRDNHEMRILFRISSRDLFGSVRTIVQKLRVVMMLSMDAEPKMRLADAIEAVGALERRLGDMVEIDKLAHRLSGIALQSVDVMGVISRVTPSMNELLRQRGVELRVRSNRVAVLAEPLILERVIVNLLENALTRTGGGVLLAVRRQGQEVSVEVWDQGPRVDSILLEQIFAQDNSVEHIAEGWQSRLVTAKLFADKIESRLLVRSLPNGLVVKVLLPYSSQINSAHQSASFSGAGENKTVAHDLKPATRLHVALLFENGRFRHELAMHLARHDAVVYEASSAYELERRMNGEGGHVDILVSRWRIDGIHQVMEWDQIIETTGFAGRIVVVDDDVGSADRLSLQEDGVAVIEQAEPSVLAEEVCQLGRY